jgi:hypothetical protein
LNLVATKEEDSMKIAFLGWGSLIWDCRNLRINGTWQEDGPFLPIEFRRYSNDGRITLVIYPGAKEIRVLWALAETTNINFAIKNLRQREGTSIEGIGYTIIEGRTRSILSQDSLLKIRQWAQDKDLNAVVWADLPENPDIFREKTTMEMTDDNIIKYLSSLEKEKMIVAKNYIERAPNQIDTFMRKKIKEKLGW